MTFVAGSGYRTPERIAWRSPSLPAPRTGQDGWQTTAHRQLSEVFRTATRIPFDDSSRIAFLSDSHRGDDGRTDAFAQNKALYLQTLTHYYCQGFTYIEVGDGDELWKNPHFSDVRRAHRPIFELLHKFDQGDRLHLIRGNHDIQGQRHAPVIKDGIATHEGLVLQHTETGQQILVAHGHQADFESDPEFALSRFVVRYIWRYLQWLGFGRTPIWAETAHRRFRLERRIMERLQAHKRTIEGRITTWLRAHRQVVICGHTHLARCAARGTPPYFNTGSCLIPGQITGLEIQGGQIALVQWSSPRVEGRVSAPEGAPASWGVPHIERKLLAPPRRLSLLHVFS